MRGEGGEEKKTKVTRDANSKGYKSPSRVNSPHTLGRPARGSSSERKKLRLSICPSISAFGAVSVIFERAATGDRAPVHPTSRITPLSDIPKAGDKEEHLRVLFVPPPL